MKVSDITIPLTNPSPNNSKHVYLCVFDNKNWIPIDFAPITNNHTTFKNIGREILYMPLFFSKNEYFPASHPVILRKDGSLSRIQHNDELKQQIKLTRKYPLTDRMKNYSEQMIGGRFQGSSRKDFKNPVDLFQITSFPDPFIQYAKIKNNKKFRYVRYLTPKDSLGTVAELQFFDENNKLLKGEIFGHPDLNEWILSKAFDGFISDATKVKEKKEVWYALDLEKDVRISKIGFAPRNDTNHIEEGCVYELYYWNNGWSSLGIKKAYDKFLDFNNAPSGALFWLRNLTKGKEERIFLIEDGRQVWW